MTRKKSSIGTLLLLAALALRPTAPVEAQHRNRHDPQALAEDPRLSLGQIAPVLEGLGDDHHKVMTKSERAQLFFDQVQVQRFSHGDISHPSAS